MLAEIRMNWWKRHLYLKNRIVIDLDSINLSSKVQNLNSEFFRGLGKNNLEIETKIKTIRSSNFEENSLRPRLSRSDTKSRSRQPIKNLIWPYVYLNS